MRKVIGIGETVLDIIFRDNRPIEAVPGGSAFNAVVSLGRCGVPATFLAETGDDRIGSYVKAFLKDNGVDDSFVTQYAGTKSPLSLAFLNEHNDAEYIFYKDHPHDRLELTFPEINADDVVVFGSFFSLNPVVRPQVEAFFSYARARGAILYYDVNFRASHRDDILRITPNLIDNLEAADFVRGSHEDFAILYNQTDPRRAYRDEISFYCRKFICTQGSRPVVVMAEDGFDREYPVAPMPTVSTIGAGDNFNAGFIFALLRDGITRRHIDQGLTPDQWDRLVASALEFSADCCKDIYNYVSHAFAEAHRL